MRILLGSVISRPTGGKASDVSKDRVFQFQDVGQRLRLKQRSRARPLALADVIFQTRACRELPSFEDEDDKKTRPQQRQEVGQHQGSTRAAPDQGRPLWDMLRTRIPDFGPGSRSKPAPCPGLLPLASTVVGGQGAL
ncbi:hypothetical protein CMUS01_09394 [Colletotrichum musicola]|uniref:Uncharacterized protein n=1 Tax=Colletotrichum musicola TaxID=2175873 RepID=A0A8H6K7X7_9PEZI|nr:hypothetical protein CMUS01_09394 [Colletotrichum musicola]